ncbi:HPF/RaiA family ribosome-associated protein [Borrelia coriaceae]|uniref:Ribosome-associated factor Y n=1 Tax=Borrelia coriaceae ATCC 43381 TaxID=1408429 RepID=W5SUL0_9SPIR|nr:HPF/RaiA family ribosome-associated protein [Borrelia coriaceae]AHH10625.1 Ribosome-associated factor Y [Borrelia coriaceae ATCC 43381]UPA16308.1 HPF/RaiA family ribosome-associated protein [Borrelia coriaceae]
MDPKIQAINYHLSNSTKDFIAKKLEKLGTHITQNSESLKITIKKENDIFDIDAHLHFNWGKIIHITEKGKELYALIERLIERLQNTANKEKNKKDTIK